MGFFANCSRKLFGVGSNVSTSIATGKSIITEPDKMACVFDNLINNQRLIKVTIRGEDGNHSYSSIVINVNRSKRLIYLDEFSHKEGHELMLNSGSCIVDSSFEGVTIKFQTKIAGTGKSDGISFYGLHFPEELRYHQRRSFFRAHVPLTMNAVVNIRVPGRAFVTGTVRDVSMGGMNIEFDNTPLDLFTVGDTLEGCTVLLPEGKTAKCPIEVCSFKRERGNMRLGAKFLDIPTPSRRIISRFVIQADKDMRKNKK